MKNIAIILLLMLVPCCDSQRNAAISMDDVEEVIYSGDIAQVIDSDYDVMRLSMTKQGFADFKNSNSSRWPKWERNPGLFYISVKGRGSYEMNFTDLSYSLFRDDKWDYSIVLVWRPTLDELWVFKADSLM